MSTGRLAMIGTLVSLCVALFASWFFVLRNAEDRSEVIGIDEFLSDGSEQSVLDIAEVGKPAPVVVLEDFEGASVSSDSLYGTPTVINFWATYCIPCITEMPMLEEVSQELAGEVNFVGVNAAESVDTATPFIERTGVTFRQLRDPDIEALGAFGGMALPHTVVLDADGTVVASKSTELKNKAELMELVEAAR